MKRKLITLRRIIVAGNKDFFRNSWLSVAATAVMVVALLIVLMTVVLNITAQNAITELSKNLKISAYIKDEAKQNLVEQLQAEIKANPYVANVTYVSKNDAQKQFIASFQNDKKLLEGLATIGGNALPASLEISVTDLSKIQEVGQIPQKSEYKEAVESVTLGKTDAKKTIERAAAAQKYITTASLIAAAIFGVVSILIIFNTIRMAIFTRGEEIKIMKLIGATPGYIRGPFVVQAAMYGIVAGILASSAMMSIIYSLGGKIANQAEFSETYNFLMEPKTIAMMFGSAVLLGIMVGIFSSILAMGKHLRLKKW